MQQNLYLLGDVARMLGVQRHKIVYLFEANKTEDVPTLGNRRVFSAADVKRIAGVLGVPWDASKLKENSK